MAEKPKRKRAANLTQLERTVLVDLCAQYSSSIDDKRTDGWLQTGKVPAWKKSNIEINNFAHHHILDNLLVARDASMPLSSSKSVNASTLAVSLQNYPNVQK